MSTARWTVFSAAVEPFLTGLILLISPSLFGWLVLGNEFSKAGVALGRLAGIVLVSLAVACWPPPGSKSTSLSTLRALLIYNLLATLYLVYLGIEQRVGGILLWPAAVLHATLLLLTIRVWLNARQGVTSDAVGNSRTS
jgi:uncharacterized membrane protein